MVQRRILGFITHSAKLPTDSCPLTGPHSPTPRSAVMLFRMIVFPRLLAFGFASPLWLWALGGVAIPVAIHLWRRQTPQIERWAAMQFLRAAIERHARRLRLESLLLLIVRCLVLALLALAVAEPIQESDTVAAIGTRRVHKVLVLDGSLSMSARTGTESRFDRGRQQAREIVHSSSAGDTFHLCRIGNAASPVIIRRPAHDHDDVLREIDRVPLLDDAGDIEGALRQIQELLHEVPPDQSSEVYLISDFQATNWSGDTPAQETQLRQALKDLAQRSQLFLVDAGMGLPSNVALRGMQAPDRVAITGRPFRVQVDLASFSADEEMRSLEVLVDNVVRASQSVTLAPWSEQQVTATLRIPDSGPSVVIEARIGPDAIASDNQIRRVVSARQSLDVLLVDGHPSDSLAESASGFLQLAISPTLSIGSNHTISSSVFQPTVCTSVELSEMDLRLYDCIVLCDLASLEAAQIDRLTAFVNDGGGLIVSLGDQTDREAFQRTLGAALLPVDLLEYADHTSEPVNFETRDLDHPVLAPFRGHTDAGLSTAPVSRYARVKPRIEGNWQVILPYTTGDPALLERTLGRGRTVLVTTSLNDSWGHWVLWPSYVPLVNRLLQHSLEGRLRSDPVTVGTPIREVFPHPVEGTVLLPSAQSVDALVETTDPETALFWPDTGIAGTYHLSAGPPVNRRKSFAVNPDPAESDLRSLTLESLRRGLLAGTPFEWVTDIRDIPHEATSSASGQNSYARPVIWGVMAMLFVEMLMAWRSRWGVAALGGTLLVGLLLWVAS